MLIEIKIKTALWSLYVYACTHKHEIDYKLFFSRYSLSKGRSHKVIKVIKHAQKEKGGFYLFIYIFFLDKKR